MADWWMSDGEIASDYRLAKDQVMQVKILAELNDATLEETAEKLVSIGLMTKEEAEKSIRMIRAIGRGRDVTPAMEKECMKHYKEFYSDSAIAELVGTTRMAVLNWRKRNRIAPNNPSRTVDGRWYSNGKKKKHKVEVER